jgi:hypothetical protein
MATQQPTQHIFKAVKCFKQVRHYQSEKELNNDLLTSSINIGKDREFNKSKNVSYWLKLREPKKWGKNITGLKKTKNPYVYFGDIPTIKNGVHKPAHLLVFVFNKTGTKLKIHLYKNYYPSNKNELNNILAGY